MSSPLELHLLAAVSIGFVLGWLAMRIHVANVSTLRQLHLQALSAEYDALVREVESLRAEERRSKPVELLDKSARASEEIDKLRRRLRELGLYDGPERTLPTLPKPRNYQTPAVSEEQYDRGSEWWRERQ
jgi:hypothetical protein